VIVANGSDTLRLKSFQRVESEAGQNANGCTVERRSDRRQSISAESAGQVAAFVAGCIAFKAISPNPEMLSHIPGVVKLDRLR
jgi:hypothetical protein